jgi:hypothetical protein
MGIFCVSAPAIKPIFKRFTPQLLSSHGYTDSKSPYFGSSKPSDTTNSHRRHSRNMWFKNRGVFELGHGPRSASFVKGSAVRSQSSSEFWQTRDVENDATSSVGVLPFMGTTEKPKNVVYKHTVFTVVETRHSRTNGATTPGSNHESSIESGEDLSNRSVLKFSSP